MGAYLTATPGVDVVRERVGRDAKIEGIAFWEKRKIGEVSVSFTPLGICLVLGRFELNTGERSGL